MRQPIICVIVGVFLAACGSVDPLAKLAAKPISAPSKTCSATPQTASPIHPGDDAVVDNAKLRRIVGTDAAGWSACQSYIARLRKGA